MLLKEIKIKSINEEKYQNIIIFFAQKISNGSLGKLKMMKLLYFLDFTFFEKYGRPVSGDEYLRFEHGPVPRYAAKVIQDAVKSKMVKISKKKMSNGLRDKELIEPLVEFNPSLFSQEEIIMMDEIANKWEKHTGTEMRNYSHGEAPWIGTKPDQVIDYNLAYYRNTYGEMENL